MGLEFAPASGRAAAAWRDRMQSTVPIVAGGAADAIAGYGYGDLAVRGVRARSAPRRWLEEFLSSSLRIGPRQ